MSSNRQPARIHFGLFALDIESGELRKADRPVRLQPQPSKILATLVARPGQLVTREELKQLIWNGTTFVDFEQGGTSQQGEPGKTFVVPIGPVDPFSQLPDSGIQSEADLLKLIA